MYQVKNNESKNRFEVEVEGTFSFVEYKLYGNDTIALIHTEVPEEMEGKGIASALASHALEYAKTHSLKVKPYCSFIKTYLERHREYEGLLA